VPLIIWTCQTPSKKNWIADWKIKYIFFYFFSAKKKLKRISADSSMRGTMIYDIYNLTDELGTQLGFVVVPYSYKQFKKDFVDNKNGATGRGAKRFLNDLREEEIFGLYEYHMKNSQHMIYRQKELAWNKSGDIVMMAYENKDGKKYLHNVQGCKEYHVCHGKANSKLLST